MYKNIKQEGLAIAPNWNMIDNIGFGKNATHTSRRSSSIPGHEKEISPGIIHPSFVVPNRAADEFTYRTQMKLGRWHSTKQIAKKLLRFFNPGGVQRRATPARKSS